MSDRRACEGLHYAKHWKFGRSPRAAYIVAFREDGKVITQHLCKRCLYGERDLGAIVEAWPLA